MPEPQPAPTAHFSLPHLCSLLKIAPALRFPCSAITQQQCSLTSCSETAEIFGCILKQKGKERRGWKTARGKCLAWKSFSLNRFGKVLSSQTTLYNENHPALLISASPLIGTQTPLVPAETHSSQQIRVSHNEQVLVTAMRSRLDKRTPNPKDVWGLGEIPWETSASNTGGCWEKIEQNHPCCGKES